MNSMKSNLRSLWKKTNGSRQHSQEIKVTANSQNPLEDTSTMIPSITGKISSVSTMSCPITQNQEAVGSNRKSWMHTSQTRNTKTMKTNAFVMPNDSFCKESSLVSQLNSFSMTSQKASTKSCLQSNVSMTITSDSTSTLLKRSELTGDYKPPSDLIWRLNQMDITTPEAATTVYSSDRSSPKSFAMKKLSMKAEKTLLPEEKALPEAVGDIGHRDKEEEAPNHCLQRGLQETGSLRINHPTNLTSEGGECCSDMFRTAPVSELGKANPKSVHFRLSQEWSKIGIQKMPVRKKPSQSFLKVSRGTDQYCTRLFESRYIGRNHQCNNMFPLFYGPAKREATTNTGPALSERTLEVQALQDGEHTYSNSIDQKELLVYEDRPQGCVLVDSDSKGASEISSLSVQWENVPLHENAIRFINGSKNFHQSDERSSSSFTVAGNQFSCLSRRHPPYCRDGGRIKKDYTNLRRFAEFIRFCSEFKEINPYTNKKNSILGHGIGFSQRRNTNSKGKIKQSGSTVEESHHFESNTSEKARINSWNIDKFSSSIQSGLHLSKVAAKKCSKLHKAWQMVPINSSVGPNKSGTELVDKQHLAFERQEHELSKEDDRNFHRCISDRMGSPLSGRESKRELVVLGNAEKQQLQRVENSSPCSFEIASESREGNSSHSTIRQHDNLFTNQSPKQSEESSPTLSNAANLELVHQTPSSYQSHPRERLRKCTSRSFKPTNVSSKSSELVPIRERNADNSKGRRVNLNRPIRRQEQCKTFQLHDNGLQRRNEQEGCILTEGVAEHGPRSPTECFNNEDNTKNCKIKQSGNFNNSILEEPTLVSSSNAIQCSISANTDNESGETPIAKTDRLDSIRKSEAHKGLSEKSQFILEKAERPHTRKSYESAWRQFCNWCAKQRLDPNSYSICNGINYLTELAETKPKSVFTHRSAISKTWKLMFPELPAFGEEELTKQVTRAVRQLNPKIPPSNKESWSIEKVLEHCESISNDTASLKELSSKLAVLISLATFCRPRSDLSRIRLAQLEWEENAATMVVTQPKEGDYKKMTIYKCSDEAICPFRCLEKYVQRTKEIRSVVTKNLFITSQKPFKDAKGDTIANWIKQILSNAGIQATAHSTRAMSSTLAKELGINEEIIMKKGNWKRKETFFKHYFRPTSNQPNPSRVNEEKEVHSKIYENNSSKFIYECTSSRRELEKSHPVPPAASLSKIAGDFSEII